MRLGRWGRSQERRRAGRPRPAGRGAALVVAALTIAGSVVVFGGGPAASAEPETRRSRHRSTQDSRTGRPARFVAEVDGRIALVSAATGRVERYLTAQEPGRAAKQPTASPDGRTVWFAREEQGNCAAHLASVPVGGGREKKLPGSGEAGAEGVPLPRPGRAQLAYARADCQDRDIALIIGDVEGLEGHGQVGLVPLDWNRSGDRLLAVTPDAQQLYLLEVTHAGAIEAVDALELSDPSPECRLAVVGFSPDANDGYIAVRLCGSGGDARRSLVLLRRDGAIRRTVVRLPRGLKFADHVTFDRTGHSLLYSTRPAEAVPGDTSEMALWLWRDGETRRLARHSPYRHPSWLS